MANFRNSLNFGREMRSKYSYPPNGNNPLTPHVINTPAVTPNINGQILPPQINNILQISPNVCNGVNALNPYYGNSCPLPGNNPYIVDNSPHAVNDKSSMMRDYHISFQQQQQKRFYKVPVISKYMGFAPTNNYFPNDNNPLVPHVINAPAITPNINGQILPPQISYLDIPQISPNVCSSFSPLPNNDTQNFSIMDSSSHAVNDNYQDQEYSTMHDCCISLQQQQLKRDYEVPGFSEYMVSIATNSYPPNGNNPLVPNVISTPAVTHNINGQILSPQMNHHNIPQISPNVCNGVNTFNPSCGNSCPLSGNNPSIVYNSPHAANNNYQGQECSTMCDYHISQQKQVYELPEFPGNVGFTLTNNHQFAQSMNIPQIDPGGQIQGSLSNYGSTVQSYVPDNNCVRQSSETTSLQNYQNYYKPIATTITTNKNL